MPGVSLKNTAAALPGRERACASDEQRRVYGESSSPSDARGDSVPWKSAACQGIARGLEPSSNSMPKGINRLEF